MPEDGALTLPEALPRTSTACPSRLSREHPECEVSFTSKIGSHAADKFFGTRRPRHRTTWENEELKSKHHTCITRATHAGKKHCGSLSMFHSLSPFHPQICMQKKRAAKVSSELIPVRKSRKIVLLKNLPSVLRGGVASTTTNSAEKKSSRQPESSMPSSKTTRRRC